MCGVLKTSSFIKYKKKYISNGQDEKVRKS